MLQLVAHLAVVGEKIERPGDHIVHQRLADKNFRGVGRVDFSVGHRPVFHFQPIEPGALLHHHATGIDVPKRLAVGNLEQVTPQIERPRRV